MYAEFQEYLLDAIEAVLGTDEGEVSFAEAVRSRACLMAGISSEEAHSFRID